MTGISHEERGRLTTRAALASIVMALILIVLKTYAALQTSSMAMLGSLADSGLDLVASLIFLLQKGTHPRCRTLRLSCLPMSAAVQQPQGQ